MTYIFAETFSIPRGNQGFYLTLTLILGEGVNYLTLRVQFYANECNKGETLTPNPNECNSTLTSGTNNIYPYPYIDVNDRGHRFRSRSPLTNYTHAETQVSSSVKFDTIVTSFYFQNVAVHKHSCPFSVLDESREKLCGMSQYSTGSQAEKVCFCDCMLVCK